VKSDSTNILMAGVGGQGVILASFLLSQAAVEAGYDIKQSEVHGMAQRGGSVTSHLRIGEEVFSPVLSEGMVDVMLSFEPLEAVRNCHFLKADGLHLYNTARVNPSTVTSGALTYPDDVEERIASCAPRSLAIDATALAEEAGSARSANVVLLGALSTLLPIEEGVWDTVLHRELPAKILDLNLRAFAVGRAQTKDWEQ
jgi:indolepyruvate ferredoxin oxidoreductase beta subunit